MSAHIIDLLEKRGYLSQATHREQIEDLLKTPGVSFYVGFDPTADSLHIGHYIQLMVMRHLQDAGHRAIALMGGGTAMIGDPSGRTDMRQMLTIETISHNITRFEKQMRAVLDFQNDRALIVNNADWLLSLNYIEFLRDIGPHFSVNRMLTCDCYKQRMEKGLSFLEFNYMPLQSYDFLHLYKTHHCVLQIGGDDQWSNIIGGVELIRRKEQGEAYGLTTSLLTTSEGHKMGKTARGALWLDANRTSPFDFYQYWRNIDDADVITCLKRLTFLPLDDIAAYEKLTDAAINEAKKRLAYEVTKIIHQEPAAEASKKQAEDLFEGSGISDEMPTTVYSPADLQKGLFILDILLASGMVASKGQGRRLIEQKGIYINDAPLDDPFYALAKSDFTNGDCIIRKGKKMYHRIRLA